MSAECFSDVKFEIGHVLFIDIVGYSKLLISEQSELRQTLKEIVRGTEQCRLAEAEARSCEAGRALWWIVSGIRHENFTIGHCNMAARTGVEPVHQP